MANRLSRQPPSLTSSPARAWSRRGKRSQVQRGRQPNRLAPRQLVQSNRPQGPRKRETDRQGPNTAKWRSADQAAENLNCVAERSVPNPPHPEQPERAAAPPAATPPNTEHPAQAAIKPSPPPPTHPEHPPQAAIKPSPSAAPPSAAPAAARPAPPANRPARPPSKTLAEVNGHPVCK